MRYYSFDTIVKPLKDILKRFLLDNNINFEISGAGAGWHFEILTNTSGLEMINNFLDNIGV